MKKNINKSIKKFRRVNEGISMVEVIVVIAVLGIILSVTLPQFAKMRENQVLKNGVLDVVSALNKARSQTLASVDLSSYGVYFQSDTAVIFKGSTFSENDANNVTVQIIPPASISSVTLNGEAGDTGFLFFDRLSGTPSKTGTVTVSTAANSKTITISATGAVSIE